MTIVVVKGERQQLLFLSDIGGTGTSVAYADLEVEILDEITVTVCQED